MLYVLFFLSERKFDRHLYFCVSHIQVILRLILNIKRNYPPPPINNLNKGEQAEQVQIDKEVIEGIVA